MFTREVADLIGEGGIMKTPKKEIRLRVSETTYNAIKKVSKRLGYTMAQVVRFGLIDYLSKKGGYHND